MKMNKIKSISLGAIIGASTCLSLATGPSSQNDSDKELREEVFAEWIKVDRRCREDGPESAKKQLETFLNKYKDNLRKIITTGMWGFNNVLTLRWGNIGIDTLLKRIKAEGLDDVISTAMLKVTPTDSTPLILIIQMWCEEAYNNDEYKNERIKAYKNIVNIFLENIKSNDLSEIMLKENSCWEYNTPLHFAAQCKDPAIAKALIENLIEKNEMLTLARVLTSINEKKQTPYDYALEREAYDVATFLKNVWDNYEIQLKDLLKEFIETSAKKIKVVKGFPVKESVRASKPLVMQTISPYVLNPHIKTHIKKDTVKSSVRVQKFIKEVKSIGKED